LPLREQHQQQHPLLLQVQTRTLQEEVLLLLVDHGSGLHLNLPKSRFLLPLRNERKSRPIASVAELALKQVHGDSVPAYLPRFVEGKTSRNHLVMVPNLDVLPISRKRVISRLSSRVRLNDFCFNKRNKHRKRELVISALKLESFSWFLELPSSFFRNLHRFYLLAYDAPVCRLGRIYSSLTREITKSLGPRQRQLGYAS